MPRIAPAEPPYEPQIAAELGAHHAARRAALVLFRTMAKSPRIFAKVFAGGLLDKGPHPAPARDRDRPHDGAAGLQERMGIHIALFAKRSASQPNTWRRSVAGPSDAACWTPEEQALVALVDDLLDQTRHRPGDMEQPRSPFRRGADPRGDRPGRLLPHDQLPLPSVWICRVKPTPRNFLLQRRHDLPDPSHDAAPAGAHGIVSEVVLRRAETGYGSCAAGCGFPRPAASR